MDRRLAWLLLGYAGLILLGGVVGLTRGSGAALAMGAPAALGCGIAAGAGLRGVRAAARIGFFSCALAIATGIQAALETGRWIPSLPTVVLGFGLALFCATPKRPAPPTTPGS